MVRVRARSPGRWWLVPLLSVASVGAVGGDVRLVEAVKNGDTVAVRALLQQEMDVNASEVDGTTALHWAAYRDDLETADLLIRAGANVEATNRYGVAPLSLACTKGNAAMIEKLLKAGADPNTALPEGETALMTAAGTGNVAAVKVLLAHGADVNAKEDWRGQTALMWAVAEGHGAASQVLIESGADLRARSNGGFTPMLFAVRGGWIDAVRVLLAAGANVSETAPDGTSAMVLAIINGHFELAALLLEHGADPNAPDQRGSALHALAWMRRPGTGPGGPPPQPTGNLDSLELASALLGRGANPNARITWKEIRFDRDDGEAKVPPDIPVGRVYISQVGATPFYLAAKHGDIALMRVLVANRADPLLPTVQNVTPLMAAAGLGYWEVETPGPLSGTPESERLEAVRLAWELGGDVNAVTDFGDIPLAGNGLELLYAYPKNLEQLPEIALGDMRWTGSSALHGAAVTDQPSIIQFLVEKGAKLDARNKLGWTPLMVAEGMLVAATGKNAPQAEALLRQLMMQRGLDPALYSQRGGLR